MTISQAAELLEFSQQSQQFTDTCNVVLEKALLMSDSSLLLETIKKQQKLKLNNLQGRSTELIYKGKV